MWVQIGLGRAHPTCGRLRADCHRRGAGRSFVEALNDCGHEDPRASAGSIGPAKARAGEDALPVYLLSSYNHFYNIIMYSFMNKLVSIYF